MFCSDCNNTLSFYHVFWNNILSCGSAVVGTCCWTSVRAMTVWLTRWCRSDWARWANGWPSTERPSTARGPGRTRTIQSTPMSGEAFTLTALSALMLLTSSINYYYLALSKELALWTGVFGFIPNASLLSAQHAYGQAWLPFLFLTWCSMYKLHLPTKNV